MLTLTANDGVGVCFFRLPMPSIRSTIRTIAPRMTSNSMTLMHLQNNCPVLEQIISLQIIEGSKGGGQPLHPSKASSG